MAIQRQINLSCQGLITKNNIVLELAEHFIPNGNILFSQLQKYDRFLNGIEGDKGFANEGRAISFLLPFLKAFGATDYRIEEYATVNISLMPGAGILTETLNNNDNNCPEWSYFLISSAYDPFILSVGHLMGLKKDHTYSTPLNLDQYLMDESERETIKDYADEIINLPQIDSFPDFKRLEDIFRQEIPDMELGQIMVQTVPMTGSEKVEAIIDSLEKTSNSPKDLMYIGNSVFDLSAVEWVQKNGGLAVSFNGNQKVTLMAEIAVRAGNAVILAILSTAFYQGGKEGVLELAANWQINNIHDQKLAPYQSLINQLFLYGPESFPQLELIRIFPGKYNLMRESQGVS